MSQYDGILLTLKEVTSLKPHKCGNCNGGIPKGHSAVYCSGLHGEEFFTGYYHTDCAGVLGEFYDMYFVRKRK